MHPELIELPFIHQAIKSYGLMMVIGFLSAVYLIRRLSHDITPDSQYITNAALYSLIGGVVGARAFYVIHYFDRFRGDLLSVFAIWEGGLELLGGVLLAITIIFFYMVYHKLPIRRYLDILAIGLMLALLPGRVGCFLNGCCFGRPTTLPWGVRFPYGSFAYRSQVEPNPQRGRAEPQMKLGDEYFGGYFDTDQGRIRLLRSYENLTESQKQALKDSDKLRSLPVHPTQLYASAAGGLCCLILYFFWRKSRAVEHSGGSGALFAKPGSTFALMFMVYSTTRFLVEFVRDDNPFEIDGLTVSQLISIALFLFGVVLMAVFHKMKSPPTPLTARSQ